MKTALAAVLIACGCAAAVPAMAQEARVDSLFEPIAKVLLHPRCANCHPRGDAPLQGDEGRRHANNVVRGSDGHGAPTFQCATCHGRANNAAAGVPGARNHKEPKPEPCVRKPAAPKPEKPLWHLAPAHMGWNGMTSMELCLTLEAAAARKAKEDGCPSAGAMPRAMQHLLEDPLVAWAWEPGADRSPPPIGHEAFQALVRAWLDAGAQCRVAP